MTRPTFEQACAQYVHRFTCEHIPGWARKPRADGRYYAPHYRSDREWYDNTLFHGESEMAGRKHCYSTGQTWPLGVSVAAPYSREMNRPNAAQHSLEL